MSHQSQNDTQDGLQSIKFVVIKETFSVLSILLFLQPIIYTRSEINTFSWNDF